MQKLKKQKLIEVLSNLGFKKKVDYDFLAEWFIEKEKISFADPMEYFDERHTHTVGLTPHNNPVEQGQYVFNYSIFMEESGLYPNYARRIIKGLIDARIFYTYPAHGYIKGILIDFTKTVDDFLEPEEEEVFDEWDEDETEVEY